MKNGDVVYFKKAKHSSKIKDKTEITFKGMGFGVLLGHVPPFQKDPPASHLLKLMGTIGFLTFDDVAEFLGDEMGSKCVKAFEDKYYGKLIPASEAVVEVEPEQSSSLVDENGAPRVAPSEPQV